MAGSPTDAAGVATEALASLPNQTEAPLAAGATDVQKILADLPTKDHDPLEKTYREVAGADPARAAAVFQMSEKTGESPAFIDKNFGEMDALRKAPSPETLRSISRNDPISAQRFRDPRVLAASLDDIHNLPITERVVRAFTTAMRGSKAAFERGALQEERDFVGWQRMFGQSALDPDLRVGSLVAHFDGISAADPESRIRQLDSKLNEVPQTSMAYGVPGFAPMMMGIGGYALKDSVIGGAAGTPFGPEGTLAGAALGSRIGVGEYFFKQMAGSTYNHLREMKDVNGQPMPENTAKIAALAAGAAAAGLSSVTVLPMLTKYLTKIPGGAAFIKKFTETAGEEAIKGPTMRAALMDFTKSFLQDSGHAAAAMSGFTAAEIVATEGAKSASGQPFERMKRSDALTDTLTSGLHGAISLAPLTAFGALPVLGAGMRDVHQAEQGKAFYERAGELAASSKLRERAPREYREFINDLTAGNESSHVYIPAEAAERFFQEQNIDPAKAFKALGAEVEYAEAKKTGSPVKMPFATWIDKVVGTPMYKALADDIKFDPEGLTVNESVLHQAEIKADAKRTQEEAQTAVKADVATSDAYETVKKDILARIPETYLNGIEPEKRTKTLASQADVLASQYVTAWIRQGHQARGIPFADFYARTKTGLTGPSWADEQLDNRDELRRLAAERDAKTGKSEAVPFTEKSIARAEEAATVNKPDVLNQPAYHGSPHKFEKFSIGKIGTGEGAQSFGWGLYFAGEKDVAEHYRQAVKQSNAPPRRFFKGEELKEGSPEYHAGTLLETTGKTLKGVRKEVEGWIKNAKEGENVEHYKAVLDTLNRAEKKSDFARKDAQGRLYTVEIPEDHEYLDRDRSLSEHEPEVRKVLEKLNISAYEAVDAAGRRVALGKTAEEAKQQAAPFGADVVSEVRKTKELSGAYIYDRLAEKLGKGDKPDYEAASKKLFSLGIPGMKYADEMSRERKWTVQISKGEKLVQTHSVESKTEAETLAKEYASHGDVTAEVFEPDQTFNYVIFDDSLVNMVRYEQGERGYFAPRTRVIGLMKTADPTTLLHEGSHAWLDDAFQFVKTGQADEAYLKDWNSIKAYLGVADDQKELTREQQEKFADSFEKYLYEGNAPSERLRGAFARLRNWFVKIYKDAKSQLGIEINNDIRAVFDRMLASEEEIGRASQESGYKDSEIADLPGLDESAKRNVRTLQERARTAAEEQLLSDQMQELKADAKKSLAEREAKVRENAERDLESHPVYAASDDLRRHFGLEGEMNTASFKDTRVKDAAQKFLDGKLDEKDVSRFEATAEEYGFVDGRDLAAQIARFPTLAEEVENRVQMERESAKDSELRNSGALREKALEAIHSDRATELLALEHQILRDLMHEKEISAEVAKRHRAQASLEARTAKQEAVAILAEKSIKEAGSFRPYIAAERQAAVRVSKAIAKGDMQLASAAKRQQMLNHALASEAMRNRAEIGRIEKQLNKYASRGNDLMNMPFGMMNQIDVLLARNGLAEPRPFDGAILKAIAVDMAKKGEDPRDIANATGLVADASGNWTPETLPQFVQRVNDNYYAMALPDSVMTPGSRTYDDLKMRDLRDLKLAVNSIGGVGRGYTRFLSAFLKGDLKQAAHDFREAVEKATNSPRAPEFGPGSEHATKTQEALAAVKNLPDTVMPDLVNVLTICEYLDRGHDGPAHEYLYRPLLRAENDKLARVDKMRAEFNDLLAKHYTPEERAAYATERQAYGEIGGRYLTKEEVLMMAMNTGNDGNVDRLLSGFHLKPEDVKAIIERTLSPKDIEHAQAVWNYLDTFWPEVKALEMQVNGVEPTQVEAKPMFSELLGVKLRGGYYPIAFDFAKSVEALRHEEERNALYKTVSTAAAHTEQGHAIARVKHVERPLSLETNVVFNHLENVVHDLAYRTAVIDVSRFLNQTDTKVAIANSVGLEGYGTISRRLKLVASDQGEYLTGMDKFMRWFRFNSTMATLAVRPFTLPMDLVGNVANGIWEIGPSRMMGAMSDFLGDTGKNKDFVNANSERMKHRAMLRDRDMGDLARKWNGKESAVQQYAFVLQSLADEAISYPLWLETYKGNLDKGHLKATALADEVVTRTVGSGSMLDRVGAQEGSEARKVTSMFYSWMSMMFNRAWLSGKLAGLEYNEGNVGNAITIAAKATFFAWGVQSLNENFWRELIRNSKNDDEKGLRRRVLSRTLQQPFGYVWLARDMAGYAINKALDDKTAQYRLSPLESALESVLKPFGEAANIAFTEKKMDKAFAEDVARSSAILLAYPQQLNTWTFNFLDWMSGEGNGTWRDLLSRRVKK